MATLYATLVDDSDDSNGLPPAVHSLTPPMTGCLKLFQWGGMKHITRRLLSPPGGVHFRRLVLGLFREEDFLTTTALVEGCSHTLEYLDIQYVLHCT